jgi:hypothetical protein
MSGTSFKKEKSAFPSTIVTVGIASSGTPFMIKLKLRALFVLVRYPSALVMQCGTGVSKNYEYTAEKLKAKIQQHKVGDQVYQ